MRRAEESRNIVEKGEYEKAKIQWENIECKVESAINEGKNFISIDGWIESINKIKLEKLGYKVSSGSHYNESYFTVSW